MLVLKQDPTELYSQGPKNLNYGEIACSKDGHLFVGDENGQPVSRIRDSDQLQGHPEKDFLKRGQFLEENTFQNLKYSEIVKKNQLADENYARQNQTYSYRATESKYSSQSKESDFLIKIPKEGVIPYSFRIIDNDVTGFPELQITGLKRVEKDNEQGMGIKTSIETVTEKVPFGDIRYFKDLEKRIKDLETRG